jgi:hypothetical protein
MLQVRQALGSKVSRERVGTELEGMFAGECLAAQHMSLGSLECVRAAHHTA